MRSSKKIAVRFRIMLVAGATVLGLIGSALALEQGPGHPGRSSIGRLKPRNARAITSSPWGIQTGTLERNHIEKAAEIGVKWTRLQASWKEIERTKGTYQWKDTDLAFETALDVGITPFVCLTGSNPLYSRESVTASAKEVEIYGTNPLPPTRDSIALAAWLRFVKATIERYRTRIHYWEIWNEPNHWAYWGAPPDGNEYGKLVRATASVIRTADPNAKILGGALAGLDPEFTDKFLSNGGAELIDIVSFHNYAAIPEERIYKAVETWNVINKYKPALELWQGECGYPSHSSTRDFRGTSPWGVAIQAKWLLRQSFTDIFFCRTTLSNYFKLVHKGGRGELPKRSFLTAIDSVLGFPDRNGSRVKSVGVNEKCLLQNPDLTPKPAYYAYQNLCAVFDNRYSRQQTDVKTIVRDQGSFYGIGREDDAFPSIPLVSTFKSAKGSWFVAYWLPWHPQEMVKAGKIDLTACSMTFRDPVLVDLLEGIVYPVTVTTTNDGKCLIEGLPLADYPFAIVERNEIEIEK